MSRITTEIWLKGVPLCPGVAVGRACFYRQMVPHQDSATESRAAENVAHEERRLYEALGWMSDRLQALAEEARVKLDSETAEVFRAHQLILEDPDLRQRLFEAIASEGLSAEYAVESQLELYQTELRALDFPYLRERAADLAELQRDLLNCLRRVHPSLHCKDMSYCRVGQCRLDNDHVLVTPELTPGLTIEVGSRTRGFLVEKGGRNSHAAILANALRLPAVSGIGNLQQTVPLDAHILIDGETGEVILNPSAETLNRYQEAIKTSARELPVIDPIPGFRLMANIDRPSGVREALATAAEGIGLYRTEIEVLAKGRLLTETEQIAGYREVVEAMGERPVYIRLLDLGADKAATWLGLPQEANPALGCRGARLLLTYPELLRDQARALAQVATDRPIQVVYPLIVDLEQFRRLRVLFDSAIADLAPSMLSHGVMFEVPSACLQARALLEEADFGCIGTNDLVQYLFAADRLNERIDYDSLLDHPVLWNLIETLAKTARIVNKPLSLCGELGGDPRFARWLIAAGIKTISVSPGRITRMRQAVRE